MGLSTTRTLEPFAAAAAASVAAIVAEDKAVCVFFGMLVDRWQRHNSNFFLAAVFHYFLNFWLCSPCISLINV